MIGSTLPLKASPPQHELTGPQQDAASPVASTRRAASPYFSRTRVVRAESVGVVEPLEMLVGILVGMLVVVMHSLQARNVDVLSANRTRSRSSYPQQRALRGRGRRPPTEAGRIPTTRSCTAASDSGTMA